MKLSCNADALDFAGGTVAQEVHARVLHFVGCLEDFLGSVETVGRKSAQAYSMQIKDVVILERILL